MRNLEHYFPLEMRRGIYLRQLRLRTRRLKALLKLEIQINRWFSEWNSFDTVIMDPYYGQVIRDSLESIRRANRNAIIGHQRHF